MTGVILSFRPATPAMFTTPESKRSGIPFRSTYRDTLTKLNQELDYLRAREAFMQVVTDRPNMIRQDGQLRADAHVTHPGCGLTIVTKAHGTLVYTCDRFTATYSNDPPAWQANLRAIALGLHDLRRLERYGIADRGQQYAGFRELGSGTALGPGTMTVDEAAAFVAGHSSNFYEPEALLRVPGALDHAYRLAAKALHPDAGGDQAEFNRLTEARALLDLHHKELAHV